MDSDVSQKLAFSIIKHLQDEFQSGKYSEMNDSLEGINRGRGYSTGTGTLVTVPIHFYYQMFSDICAGF